MRGDDQRAAAAAELIRRRESARWGRRWCEMALLSAFHDLDAGKPIERFMMELVDAYNAGPGTPGWVQPVTAWGGRPPGLEGLDQARFEQAVVEWEKTPGDNRSWDEVLCSPEYAAICAAMDGPEDIITHTPKKGPES